MNTRRDTVSGAALAAVGAAYCAWSISSLSLGRLTDMGPGFFPLLLSGCLAVFGVAIAIRGAYAERDLPMSAIPWRGAIAISAAIVVFALSLLPAGLFPAVFVTAMIASAAREGFRPMRAALFAVSIATIATIVFAYLVKLPVPVIGPLFWG